jgi:hypothetical protein
MIKVFTCFKQGGPPNNTFHDKDLLLQADRLALQECQIIVQDFERFRAWSVELGQVTRSGS